MIGALVLAVLILGAALPGIVYAEVMHRRETPNRKEER